MGLPWNVNASMGGSGINDQILRSLRFRASATAYMARTPSSASNQTTWTWSAWVKKGNNSSYGCMFGAYTGAGATYTVLQWQNDNTLVFYNQTSSSITMNLNTTQVFRDPSAWYHVVAVYDSTQATASNRGKIYINGVQVTAFSTATYPSLNANATVNSAVPHDLGRFGGAANYFDGYLAEVNFIDGQALTPSSFGYYDPQTGVWQPAPFKGTYGTNGFYLPFTDIATTSGSNFGLGRDYSGNSNYWNTNNISVTSGTSYDSMIDSPTNFSDGTGIYNRGNYCVMNPITQKFNSTDGVATFTNGNLQTSGAGATVNCNGTIGAASGKYYYEAYCNGTQSSGSMIIGFNGPNGTYNLSQGLRNNATFGGSIVTGSAFTYAAGDTIGVAFDAAARTCIYYKNGVQQFTGTFSGGAEVTAWCQMNGTSDNIIWNFGQRPFSYTPPTGYVCLNTFNLPTPTIANGAAYMAATTYTGNNSTNTINNGNNTTNATSFQPDMVWIKSRSSVTNHMLNDSVRGVGKDLYPNLTAAESTTNLITSFNTNGFTLGPDGGGAGNGNALTYVGWQWQAGAGTTSSNTSGSITSTVSVSAQSGFSVVTWGGNSTSPSTIGHGLGVAPSFIINKRRDQTGNWIVYHSSVGNTGYLILNSTSVTTTSSTAFNNTSPTSSVFTVGNLSDINTVGSSMVSYCFAAVRGYSAFGSYVGNASSDGPFVYLGFRPRWIMVKSSTVAHSWEIYDTSRDPYNVAIAELDANSSAAEYTAKGASLDFLSNGFKIRYGSSGFLNVSGQTYIYAAFAENPFNYSRAR